MPHIKIDMRVVMWRRRTDAFELPRTDGYLRNADIIFKSWPFLHQTSPACLRLCLVKRVYTAIVAIVINTIFYSL